MEENNNQTKGIFNKIMALPVLKIFVPFYKKNKELLLYLFFGGFTFIISVFTYAYFNSVLGINELVANIMSWIIAVFFAFVTNRVWVFQAITMTIAAFMKQMIGFYGGRIFTLAVEELILFIFITKLGMSSIVTKLVAQIIVIVLNYVISKRLIFKKNIYV